MSLRDALNKRPALSAVIAILVMLAGAAVGFVLLGGGAGPQHRIPTKAWFLDTETGERFTLGLDAAPPVPPPNKSTPSGVRLHVFACGTCADQGNQFPGYLETSTEQAKQAHADMDKLETGELQGGGVAQGGGMAALERIIAEGETVSPPEKPYNWLQKTSPEGQAVLVAPMTKCGSGNFNECYPP